MKVIHTKMPIVGMSVMNCIVLGRFFDRFSESQKAAIISHEEGHIFHRHALVRLKWIVTGQWKNLLRRCLLQEFEADAFAVKNGHAEGLKGFLKLIHAPEGPLHPSSEDRIANINRLTTA
jgi:beta-lactamase regulating signal transducer with metallopeptidase domain